jgi:hypothetical protein
MLIEITEMDGEPLMAGEAVFGAAHRPEQDQAERAVRVHGAERGYRAAAHAAAHDVRALDLEMVKQPDALRDIIGPGDAFDPAARLPGLAAVEGDAGVLLRQMVEQLDLGVDALRAPFVERGIESAWRIHQDRRA